MSQTMSAIGNELAHETHARDGPFGAKAVLLSMCAGQA